MKKIQPLSLLCALASSAGFVFAAVSTSDFVAHLDRQVHGIHCSFLPGLAAADQTGESGCHTTLMSPYSSVLRETVWGGIPVALPAMPVFAFLAFFVGWIVLRGLESHRRATATLFLGTLVPLLTSVGMGYLSFAKLDAACKLCIGIYASSAVASLSAFLLWRRAIAQAESLDARGPAFGWRSAGIAAVLAGVFVTLPVGAYAWAAPDFSTYVGACGSLPHFGHEPSVLLNLGEQRGRTEMLEVLDPLCPSCKGFEERWGAMERGDEVDRKALLFPLDDSCNWMIDRAIHPGACSVSEAVLCAETPEPVLDWAFQNQKAIMEATAQDAGAAERMAKAAFPRLSSCIGSAAAKAKVNQSLRWAVKNQLQVLTPQVFVNGWRLCGEDTDLGLDFALSRLIEKAKSEPRPRAEPEEELVRADVQAAKGTRPAAKAEAHRAPRPEVEEEDAPPSEAKEKESPDVKVEERPGENEEEEARSDVGAEPEADGENETEVSERRKALAEKMLKESKTNGSVENKGGEL